MHVHVNALSLFVTFLGMVALFGVANILAQRYAGHPAADAWADIYGSGSN